MFYCKKKNARNYHVLQVKMNAKKSHVLQNNSTTSINENKKLLQGENLSANR